MIHFSTRLPSSYAENPLIELFQEKKRSGEKILDLTVSNPTHVGLAYPEADIVKAYTTRAWMRYDPDPEGLREARAAIETRYYGVRGFRVAADNIVLTASSSESYQMLFKLLADPGEGILVPEPSYPLFEPLLALEGIRKVPYALSYRDGLACMSHKHLMSRSKRRGGACGWRITVDALDTAIRASDGPVKAIVVVNPNNPTGSFLSVEDWQAVVEVALLHDLAIISDEVFWDYPLCSVERQSGTTVDRVLTFTLNGLSKSAALPQLKLGWICVSGPPHVVKPAKAHLGFIADCALSVSGPVQFALPDLLDMRLHELVGRRVCANAQWLQTLKIDRLDLTLGHGGWSALIRLPQGFSDAELCEWLLRERQVWVYPGYFFDFPEGEEWLVVSLLPEPAVLKEGMRAITERVR
jgi:aspartate/methionine/tyrosine aminotransferase